MNEREGLVKKDDGERVFNFRPLFFLAVFLVLGILFGYFSKIDGVSAWWLLLLLPVLIPPFFFCKRKENALIFVALLLLFFVIGNISFSIAYANFESLMVGNEQVIVIGRVVESRLLGSSYRVVLDGLYFDETAVSGKLIAYLPATFGETVRLSDTLLLTGKIGIYNGYSELDGLNGGYIADGLRYSMSGAKEYVVTGHTFDLFLEIRQRMLDVMDAGMDESAAGIMKAMLLGETSGVQYGLLSNIRAGGIAHVFAVSGLHVGALYAFCILLAKKLKFSKPLAFCIVFFVLVLYGGVCGYSSSVIRAIVTCLCFYLAREVGIKLDFIEVIGFAAIVVLLLFPTLLFDVGFQLSYGACLGLSCFSRVFSKGLNRALFALSTLGMGKEERQALLQNLDDTPPTVLGTWKNWLVSAVSSTLAAQTFTLPIMVNTFGYLSLLSVPLNCVLVPALVALFPFFLGLTLLSFALPFVAPVVLYLPAVLWHALVLPFEVWDFSLLTWSGLSFGAGATLLYCAGLVVASGKINVKGFKKWGVVLAYFVLFVVAMVAGNA